MARYIRGITIIEVLVALAIVSFTVITMLSASAVATRDATVRKINLQMNDAAVTILDELKKSLNARYNQDNWNNILRPYVILTSRNNLGFAIANAPAGCTLGTHFLTPACPRVSTVLGTTNLPNDMRYLISTLPTPTPGIYEVTVHVACAPSPGCNSKLLGKISVTGYVVQY